MEQMRDGASNFNSTMVRLEGLKLWDIATLCLNFNSTMVRLEAVTDSGYWSFTFISIPLWFDWKNWARLCFSILMLHFNSTMVRLEVWIDVCKRYGRWKFQFHYGSIGRWFAPYANVLQFIFQFHYGSIGSQDQPLAVVMQTLISIPLWFDWKESCHKRLCVSAIFQFHYGSIGSNCGRNPRAMDTYFNSTMVRLEVI